MGLNYAQRQQIHDEAVQEASRKTYLQFLTDIVCITLHDPDYMGGDAFGPDRIKRVTGGMGVWYDRLVDALSSDKHDSDYCRRELDGLLQQIFEDEFIPFSERYPCCRELKPIGKERRK